MKGNNEAVVVLPGKLAGPLQLLQPHLCSASAAELQPCPSQTTERPFQVEQSSFAKVSRLSYLCHLTDPGREFQKIQLK